MGLRIPLDASRWHADSQSTGLPRSTGAVLLPPVPSRTLVWTRETYRLTFRITNSSNEQGDKLRPEDQAVEGQRAEAFFHGPVFTWGLVRV